MDKLKKVLQSIETWCTEHNISVFYGTINDNGSREVAWTKKNENDWIKYLSILKLSGENILIIDVVVNEIDPLHEGITDHKNTLENDERIEFETFLRTVKSTKGHVAYFDLTFVHNNTCYGYSQLSAWADVYLSVNEILFDSVASKYDEFNEEE